MDSLILNAAALLIYPFIYAGLIAKVKAKAAGRKGPYLLQPFYDFIKLMKKGEVVSNVTSLLFAAAPSVNLAAVLLAGLFVPLAGGHQILSFKYDFILFVYILTAGKFFTVMAAMDTGSSFEGMGASREAFYSVFVEPAFFLLMSALVVSCGVFSMGGMFVAVRGIEGPAGLLSLLGVAFFLIMLTVETSRVPVDDPNTHLELTMIHEVMVLDNSGPDLGLINYAHYIKMVLFGSLMVNFIWLPPMGPLLTFAAYSGLLFLTSAAVGVIESVMARFRLTHIPQFLFIMTSIGLVFLLVVVFAARGGIR